MVPLPLRKLGKIGLANRSPKATSTRTMTAMTSNRAEIEEPPEPGPDQWRAAIGLEVW